MAAYAATVEAEGKPPDLDLIPIRCALAHLDAVDKDVLRLARSRMWGLSRR
jgi:hypothetical protein